MKDMDKSLNALSERIENMEKKASNSTKISAIAYLLIVLFVFGYTAVIMSLIKKQVTADNLSAQLKVLIEGQLLSDENCDKAIGYCKEQAPIWADDLVSVTHEQLIPMAKTEVKGKIDKVTDDGIKIMKRDLFPEIQKLVKENAKELSKHKDVTDQNIANELSKILATECEKEMDKFINDKVKKSIAGLRHQLDEMSSVPVTKLSNKQKAERKIIVSWVYLLEHEESPADAFGELLKGINGTYQDFMKNLTTVPSD